MIFLKIISLIITISSMLASLVNVFKKRNKSIKLIYFFNFAFLIPILLYILLK